MDNQIFYFFYNYAHQANWLDNLIIFFAVYFSYVVGVLALIFLLFYRKSWREFFIVFSSSIFAWVVAKVLKILIHTDRPFIALSNVQSLFPETGFAFPSQHAVVFAALAFAIFIKHKRAGYVFMIFTLIIGLTRIVGGVHFPGDILAGFLLGGVIAYIVQATLNKFAYFRENV